MIAQNVHNGVKQPRKCSQKLITIWDVTCYSFVLPFKILVRDVFCCWSAGQEITGSNPGQTNPWGLKMTEKKSVAFLMTSANS